MFWPASAELAEHPPPSPVRAPRVPPCHCAAGDRDMVPTTRRARYVVGSTSCGAPESCGVAQVSIVVGSRRCEFDSLHTPFPRGMMPW